MTFLVLAFRVAVFFSNVVIRERKSGPSSTSLRRSSSARGLDSWSVYGGRVGDLVLSRGGSPGTRVIVNSGFSETGSSRDSLGAQRPERRCGELGERVVGMSSTAKER